MSRKIVLSGGGSGGHITPLLAVAREIRKLDSTVSLHYIGEKGGKFGDIASKSDIFDKCHFIYAGKIRRYYNEPLLERIFDLKTHLLNVRDVFRLMLGTFQAVWLFARLKPESALLKGGFVCVPVSLGAKFTGSKIITHDSDAMPGLSNRFAAKFASYNATAMPAKYYSYPKAKVVPLGLPISQSYRPYSGKEISNIKNEFGIPEDSQVLLITGGSLGAKRLNNWSYQAIGELLKSNKKLFVVIIVGKNNMTDFANYPFREEFRSRIYAEEFTDKLYDFVGICDVAIIRAGATTIAEFAAAKKAVILVPNPQLTGGHQTKNAAVYSETRSVLVVEEKDLEHNVKALIGSVEKLLTDNMLNKKLGTNLHQTLPKKLPSAELAKLLIGAGE